MALRDLFRRKQEKRAVTHLDSVPTNWSGYGAEAGEHVSEQSALQLMTVHACVGKLADAISQLPVDVYRKTGDARVEVMPPPVLTKPWGSTVWFDWMYQLVTSLALNGNFFGLVWSRDKLEYPGQILPLHPDQVQIEESRRIGDLHRYRVEGQLVPSEDILHIKRFSLANHARGVNPISAARLGLSLGLAAERYGARWFRDSADPSSVLESPGDVTDDQAAFTQKQWVASHHGRRHPAMLSGGLTYKRISITPEESQFLETRKFQRGEIAMLFGIPPHMIGDTEKSTSWGTGIEQQSLGWMKFGLGAWLKCIEDHLSATCLPRGQFMKFNVDGLLRADIKTRYESYHHARTDGWMNVDEIRAKEDLPPLPDGKGQDYLQPLNMGPLGSDPLAAKQPAPAPNQEDDDA